jgi:hypothetical protein
LKLAVVAAAATVTEAGTVKAALLLLSATGAPPAGAALVRVTVQALVAFGPMVEGAQVNDESSTDVRTVIVPPVPAIIVPFPVGDAPTAAREIGTTEPPAAVPSTTVAVATVPLPIRPAFIPVARQETDPLAAAQLTVFPAAVRAGPAAMLMEAILPGV